MVLAVPQSRPFGGGLVPALNFLIWAGLVLLILAAVGFLRGRRRT